jgi:hypothetical protein
MSHVMVHNDAVAMCCGGPVANCSCSSKPKQAPVQATVPNVCLPAVLSHNSAPIKKPTPLGLPVMNFDPELTPKKESTSVSNSTPKFTASGAPIPSPLGLPSMEFVDGKYCD